jgi:truncated hemoglobin YjbI
MATQDSPNLYERLGGVYSIATVVDDLIDRVMADPRLNANPLVDDAHHKVPPAGFKYLVTEMLCWAAGGPQKYTGKDMESSHRHLRITPLRVGIWHDSAIRGAAPAAVEGRPSGNVVEPSKPIGKRPSGGRSRAAFGTNCRSAPVPFIT